jgi:5-methylcytosine-specific restriction endonuclease McrA
MPSRTPADQRQILDSLLQTKNMKQTARDLGLHYLTVVIAVRRSRGKCVRCAGNAAPNRKYCAECLVLLGERKKTKYISRKQKGICSSCNEPTLPGKYLCGKHHDKFLEYHRARHQVERTAEAAKRGCRYPHIPSTTQRLRWLKSKYGEAGKLAWLRDDERCVICHVPHQTYSVHVHHIDQNPTNNTLENLVCLCFSCHQTVHKLLTHQHPEHLLHWVIKTYPNLNLTPTGPLSAD